MTKGGNTTSQVCILRSGTAIGCGDSVNVSNSLIQLRKQQLKMPPKDMSQAIIYLILSGIIMLFIILRLQFSPIILLW